MDEFTSLSVKPLPLGFERLKLFTMPDLVMWSKQQFFQQTTLPSLNYVSLSSRRLTNAIVMLVVIHTSHLHDVQNELLHAELRSNNFSPPGNVAVSFFITPLLWAYHKFFPSRCLTGNLHFLFSQLHNLYRFWHVTHSNPSPHCTEFIQQASYSRLGEWSHREYLPL